MSADPSADIVEIEAWLAIPWEDRFPLPAQPPHISWDLAGIESLHFRLEDLKRQALATEAIEDTAIRLTSWARKWQAVYRHQEDDRIGDGLQRRVTELVSRGLAWDERRIVHQTIAIDVVVGRRRFEAALTELESALERIRSRSWRVRDEREDVRAQIRLINVAREIGELPRLA